MDLQLAIVISCSDNRCQVQYLADSAPVEAVLAKPLIDHEILIHPGDLVAVDQRAAPPRVVFHWMLASVVKVTDGQVYTLEGYPQSFRNAGFLPDHITVADNVFIANGEICDTVKGGMPSHPDLIREVFYPQIESIYQRFDRLAGLDPKQVVSEGYDRVASQYLDMTLTARAEERARYTAFLIDHLPAGAAVLEIGCGAGDPTTRALAQLFQVTGVDISEAQIALAKQNVPQATFIQADITQMDFPSQRFDAVVAFYSFFHIPREEQAQLLPRIARWLRPGGYLVITMGTNGVREEYDDFFDAPMYWSTYDTQANITLVKEAGFSLISAQEETAPEFGQPVTFLWVVAQKP